MSACDDSVLDEIPDDLAKLTSCIVKRWWASHALPYVTDIFHVEKEVRLFCCMLLCLYVAGAHFLFLCFDTSERCLR
jgi:hypothetical protein